VASVAKMIASTTTRPRDFILYPPVDRRSQPNGL
jgi:hypothetical protein